jgi:predicted aconitase with swiveling domain
MIRTTVLNPGACRAEVLVLDDALSFWGGFDPATGRIIDQHHPQCGTSLAGKAVAMPGSRGSAGTPAAIAEAVRRGCGPAAFLLGSSDVNIAIGAMVADRLYGGETPVLVLGPEEYGQIATGEDVDIARDGAVIR